MGLPDGWVVDPAIERTVPEQLTALGNGVVPVQAVHALGTLRRVSTRGETDHTERA